MQVEPAMLSGRATCSHIPVVLMGFIFGCAIPMMILGAGCSRKDNAPEVVWSRIYDGGKNDYARDVAVDDLGNVYVTGSSESDANTDWITIKYDARGNVVWTRSYDGGNTDMPYGIAVDSSDNVYVTGDTQKGKNEDYLTIKYDSAGNIVWSKTHDDGDYDGAFSVAVDTSGNVCVTGGSVRDAKQDILTIRYDAEGNIIWHRRYGRDHADYAQGNGIAIDNSGPIYVTARWLSNRRLHFHAIKYDPSGNIVWTRTFNRTPDTPTDTLDKNVGNNTVDSIPSLYSGDPDSKKSFMDRANDIAVDSYGSVCVTGNSYHVGHEALGHEAPDILTVKFDSGGNVVWGRAFDGGSSEKGHANAFDISGNIYVAGYSYDPSNSDLFMIKYDGDGNLIWTKSYDSGEDDMPNGIAVDSSGGIYVVGASSNGSNQDFMVLKYK